MLKFVSFAVRLQLNVHDLNNEAGAGNVTDIRIMEFLDEHGNRMEAPAVSGRMLKHWHYESMRHLILSGEYGEVALCDGCRSGEPVRPGKINGNQLSQVAKSEDEAIQECAICDTHGYLITREAGGESDRGISARRSSRVMFSWLMPVLNIDTIHKQVVHTRVSQHGRIEEDQSAQMIFYKSYASGIYAFVSALDVERIGLVDQRIGGEDPYVVDNNERILRTKVAIEAYRLLISGQMGASLSHALPHVNLREVLVCYSETGPLPFSISPMYPDYLAKTVSIMPGHARLLYWGPESPEGIVKKDSINEIFEELISKVA